MFTGLASPTHLIILLVIVLLVFGAKRLPELGRSLGQGIQEFKEVLNSNDKPKETEEQKQKRPESLEEGRDEERAKTQA